jgi:hypothetical protein
MSRLLKSKIYPFFSGVVILQSIHVMEQIIRLAQVYVFGVPEEDALGLLGYVFAFPGAEEWLRLLSNIASLLALVLVLIPLRRMVPRPVPRWAFGAFLAGAVGLEGWHVVEHMVIIANVLANGGCPCPGILDAALGLSDTVLHFFYNLAAYLATLIPYWWLRRARPRRPTVPAWA